MEIYIVNYFKKNFEKLTRFSKKGQFKIQQMAFVLVALMIFFVMVSLFYFSIRLGSLREDAGFLEEQEARELVKKLASTSEFSFSAGSGSCESCVDLDKVLMLKGKKSYDKFWGLDFLEIRKVYPSIQGKIECTRSNYPDCNILTIVESENFGSPSDAFVSLCRWESEKGGYVKCELGRIYASGNLRE